MVELLIQVQEYLLVLGHSFLGVMNPFMLLSLPLPDVLRVVTLENDKTKDYSSYLSKMSFNEE